MHYRIASTAYAAQKELKAQPADGEAEVASLCAARTHMGRCPSDLIVVRDDSNRLGLETLASIFLTAPGWPIARFIRNTDPNSGT
jgi:hypothetical protein